jgi:hypothetical protein
LREGRPITEAIFTDEDGVVFRLAFYGFAKIGGDLVHILKFLDEALPGWEEWRELPDVLRGSMPDAWQIRALKMQKYVCFWMTKERFARGANDPPFSTPPAKLAGTPVRGEACEG